VKLRQIPEVERYFEEKSVRLWDWFIVVPKWWEKNEKLLYMALSQAEWWSLESSKGILVRCLFEVIFLCVADRLNKL